MDFSKIKLIIWDLDETFWSGVLSDNTVQFNENNAKLIKNSTDAGVINAICSKNDYDEVKKYLAEHSLWEYFVFNSINWSPKGSRVKQIIQEMNLRDVNVLFIDDNHLNLQEAKEFCPNIMVESPNIIPLLFDYYSDIEKKDIKHARLEQYKLLEKKMEFKASVGSNEDFLYNCNIQVDIKDNCVDEIDRIVELIQRSNQLNFTKIRSSKEEIEELLEDKSVNCGYISVSDKFGDYGIVGFYAIRENTLIHFVFSCRTLNMGVEQYVYNYLGKPKLAIVGEVASSLDSKLPEWINHSKDNKKTSKTSLGNTKILFKGPCDLEAIFSFVKESKKTIKEFVYVNAKGISVSSGNHTSHIVQALTLDNDTKKSVISAVPFGDKDMYSTSLFDEDIGVIYLSMFTDPNLGLYKHKHTGAILAFGEWTNDLTNEALWDKFINKELYDANCRFTKDILQNIKDNFEFLGRLSPQQIVDNLDFIYSHIDKGTKLILNLGSEIEHINNVQEAYHNRHLFHIEMNTLIKEWKKDKSNVYIIEVTKYIKSQDDFTNNINHFVKPVYFQLAQELVSIIGEDSAQVREKQKINYWRKLKVKLSLIKRKLM